MNLGLHPHPSRFACHLPPLGGRLEHWQSLDCTVVSIVAPISLPPHGGRWHGEAVTDEGENLRAAPLYELKTNTAQKRRLKKER